MSKNVNGEGSIYPHKRNGKKVGYRGAYVIHTAAGPKRRYVTGKTRDELLRFDAQRLCKLADRARLRPHHAMLQPPYRVSPHIGLLGQLFERQHTPAPQLLQLHRVNLHEASLHIGKL